MGHRRTSRKAILNQNWVRTTRDTPRFTSVLETYFEMPVGRVTAIVNSAQALAANLRYQEPHLRPAVVHKHIFTTTVNHNCNTLCIGWLPWSGKVSCNAQLWETGRRYRSIQRFSGTWMGPQNALFVWAAR